VEVEKHAGVGAAVKLRELDVTGSFDLEELPKG
jgi:hypothetical protein